MKRFCFQVVTDARKISFSRAQHNNNTIHRRKKDGGCTFYHSALRT